MQKQRPARSPQAECRKKYALLAVLMAAVMLTSFGKGLDIDRRSLVHAMGIDKDGRGFKVTLQIFKPSGAGSETSVDPSTSNVRLISCKGTTVAEALEDARSQTGQELFFGHLQVICLGMDTDLSSPDELLAFALSDKSIAPATPVCLGESSAEEVISAQPDHEETSAEAFSKILDSVGTHGDTVACTLADIASCEGENLALPVLAVGEDSSSGGKDKQQESPKTAYLSFTAVISGKKVSDIKLSRDEAMCAAFISGRGEEGSLTFEQGGKKQSAKLKRQRTLRKLRTENGRTVFFCEVTLAADLTADIRDPETSKQTAKAIEDALAQSTESMIHKSRDLANTDILGIQKLFRHTFPDLYLRFGDDPMRLCRSTETDIIYKVRVE